MSARSLQENDIELGEDYLVARREAKLMVGIWLVQSAVMVGLFLALGYHRTTDPFGFPLGLPSWYLFGGIIPSIVFLFVVIYVVRRHFREVPVK